MSSYWQPADILDVLEPKLDEWQIDTVSQFSRAVQ